MKRSLLVAFGLAIALSVGAQTSPDETKEQKEKKEKAKTEQSAKPAEHSGAKPGMQPNHHEGTQTKQHEQTEASQQAAHAKTHESTTVNEKTTATHTSTTTKQEGASVRTTTVFRNGKQTSEHLTLRRGTRERTDVHFSIGTHPREWWIRTYPIVLLEGCYYYLADNGCWYPAYGFDPGCTFPIGIVFCE